MTTRNASLLLAVLAAWFCPAQAQSLRPSSANPRYFEYGGRPVMLVGASDHYGALMNGGFDYRRYLEVVSADGLNVMRVKSGVFTEPGRDGNSMEVLPGKLLTPYARSQEPGYANGGNKFDLGRWDDAYFARLKDLVAEAARRNVMVNYIFFSPFFEDEKFEVSPWKAGNYVNGPAPVPWRDIYTLDKGGGFLALQEALIRKVVAELKDAGNVLFEVTYEGKAEWTRADWHEHMHRVLLEARRTHGSQSPVIQNAGAGTHPLARLLPGAAAVQWFLTRPEVMAPHWHLNRVLAQGETGSQPLSDPMSRMLAWEFLHAGCGMYVHVDHFFKVSNPDGRGQRNADALWGGGPSQRRELGVLRRYWESLDFTRLAPATNLVRGPLPPGLTVRAMAAPGREYTLHLRPTDAQKQVGIRWTGRLVAPETGDYELRLISNDGVRLWLDGRLQVDNWQERGVAEDTVTVRLDAGQPRDFKLEFFYLTGQGELRLLWKTKGGQPEAVPASALRTAAGEPGVVAEYFADRQLREFRLRRPETNIQWNVKQKLPFEVAQFAGEPAFEINLPAGRYHARWIQPADATVLRSDDFEHAGGFRRLTGPKLNPDLALHLEVK